MADFDWKKLVSGIAPVLGTALSGPMVGAAIAELGGPLLGNRDATEGEVAAALATGRLTPEQVVAIRQADNSLAVRMRELDIDVVKLNQPAEAALITDPAEARHTFSGSENVFVLGCIILSAFALLMALVLTGCSFLMTGEGDSRPRNAGCVRWPDRHSGRLRGGQRPASRVVLLRL